MTPYKISPEEEHSSKKITFFESGELGPDSTKLYSASKREPEKQH